jgi:hypothetical protein
MANPLPAEFVRRPAEFDALMRLLLAQNRESPVAITAALRGAGGYGKTTLATAICHDQGIRNTFKGGILWATLGENPGDLIGRVEDLIQTLSGERPGFSNTKAAIARLKELLADRDILIVIDDVWNRDHLLPFMQGGSRCARLITTRKLSVLPVGIPDVAVRSMSNEEAAAMLRANLAEYEGEYSQNELPAWSQKLGKWPLLLRLVNDELRRRCARGHLLPSAMNYIKEQFEEIGITALDNERGDLIDRNRSVARSIETSLRELTEEEGARFAELAVFDLNKPIPTATLELYWALTGKFSKVKTQRFCDRLHDLSLVHYFDTKYFSILIPQAIHRFLQDQHKNEITKFRDNLLTCLVQF